MDTLTGHDEQRWGPLLKFYPLFNLQHHFGTEALIRIRVCGWATTAVVSSAVFLRRRSHARMVLPCSGPAPAPCAIRRHPSAQGPAGGTTSPATSSAAGVRRDLCTRLPEKPTPLAPEVHCSKAVGAAVAVGGGGAGGMGVCVLRTPSPSVCPIQCASDRTQRFAKARQSGLVLAAIPRGARGRLPLGHAAHLLKRPPPTRPCVPPALHGLLGDARPKSCRSADDFRSTRSFVCVRCDAVRWCVRFSVGVRWRAVRWVHRPRRTRRHGTPRKGRGAGAVHRVTRRTKRASGLPQRSDGAGQRALGLAGATDAVWTQGFGALDTGGVSSELDLSKRQWRSHWIVYLSARAGPQNKCMRDMYILGGGEGSPKPNPKRYQGCGRRGGGQEPIIAVYMFECHARTLACHPSTLGACGGTIGFAAAQAALPRAHCDQVNGWFSFKGPFFRPFFL